MADQDLRAPLFIAKPALADGRKVGVLLSHGFTGSPASMRPWAEYLADQGYTVSVPRLPGHGTTVEEMLQTRFSDYTAAIESAYADLAAQCDLVVVAGLSMGGALVLQLAENHPEIAGVVLVNAAVASTNKQLLLLPVLKHFVKTFPAIANDIKKPGIEENGYDKTPLKPLASFVASWKPIQAGLGRIECPVFVFRSADDHVVDPSSARIILAGVGTPDKTEVVLKESFHVATLDNDAPEIFATSAAFIERVSHG
ncbi:MAG TPA: alpha/beta fold hydrolase [Marmoricola sp.]|nr:alpha/beta fold hydrolase [Marmoricola sp.]